MEPIRDRKSGVESGNWTGGQEVHHEGGTLRNQEVQIMATDSDHGGEQSGTLEMILEATQTG